jgi:transposase InsO family protein
MSTDEPRDASVTRRWANLRFSIIGPLLAAPPEHGEVVVKLTELAMRTYRHPTTGEPLRYSLSTIERWYYAAKGADDPVAVLARKVPSHAGTHASFTPKMAAELEAQYKAHPGWTFQLHHDNLLALIRERPALGRAPSYTTTCRYMKHRGWLRHKRKPRHGLEIHEPRETRSFEVSHVHALWHADFHEGSRKILNTAGEWKTPLLLGVLDDHSRLLCHAQWYLADGESAEIFIHGLSQAIAKRGLPRALLTDNGAGMIAGETIEGLARLGIVHHTTLPNTPEQNAKQEVFWAQIEGRLLPMLEGERELTLALLNSATQAWAEGEYQRKLHDELGCSPLDRALTGPSVARPSPSSEELRRAFRIETTRAVRRSDATFTVGGVRFELPWRYRTVARVTVRVARWDLSSVDLVDPRSGTHLATILPLDKERNSDGLRRAVPIAEAIDDPPPVGIAPHLRQLMADYAATGLPPAYLPKDEPASATAELGDGDRELPADVASDEEDRT